MTAARESARDGAAGGPPGQPSIHPSVAPPSPAELAGLLQAARAHTRFLVEDLSDEQMRVPQLRIVNPPLWELGHVAWFQEKWNLRHQAARRPLLAESNSWFDSAAIAHDTRWELGLPDREAVLDYMRRVLEQTVERLTSRAPTGADLYFAQLALFHEDMHGEAFAYTRQTLSWPRERARRGEGKDERAAAGFGAGSLAGDVEVPGGVALIGAAPGATFVFDNEKWAHPVSVRPFAIARAATTNGEFAEFVEAGGYRRREFWSEPAWKWRESVHAEHPVYWRREPGGRWLRRRYDRFAPIAEHQPVLHVNFFEAEAFCRWRGRRLPTEAEWELAASGEPDGRGALAPRRRLFPWGDEPPTPQRAHLGYRFEEPVDVGALPAGDSAFGCRQMLGNVWEWTASDFLPYPGFVPDPYAEYSQPWFRDHKVLRGGCFVTQPRLLRDTWRNFYTPDRRDVWAGFRTCAP
jgi:iron(II)-dependent oxidoreductase